MISSHLAQCAREEPGPSVSNDLSKILASIIVSLEYCRIQKTYHRVRYPLDCFSSQAYGTIAEQMNISTLSLALRHYKGNRGDVYDARSIAQYIQNCLFFTSLLPIFLFVTGRVWQIYVDINFPSLTLIHAGPFPFPIPTPTPTLTPNHD
jgi:hypothetical protein